MIASLAIAIRDEQDLASGHKRKKQGDIIAVKPAGWKWGHVERKTHLIIEVDLGPIALEQAEKLLLSPGDTGEKRKFKIPVTALTTIEPTIEWVKVEDVNVDYQPLEGRVIDGASLIYNKTAKRIVGTSELWQAQELQG